MPVWGENLLANYYKICYLVRTKNEAEWIGAFLDSLQSQERVDNSLLIFLDSGSTDNTLDLARLYKRPSCCFKIDASEFSFGDTCNLLIEMAPSEYVAFLSAHVILCNAWCMAAGLAEFLDETVAAVSFRQIEHRGIGASIYEDIFLKLTFPALCSKRNVFPSYPFSNAGSMLRKIAWAQVAFRSVVASEDALWARDIVNMGWCVLYLPNVIIEHSHNERPSDVYKRVRINKIARYGATPQLNKFLMYFIVIYILLLFNRESLGRCFKYAYAHSAAYFFSECPRAIC